VISEETALVRLDKIIPDEKPDSDAVAIAHERCVAGTGCAKAKAD
jgi:hypothetical protein